MHTPNNHIGLCELYAILFKKFFESQMVQASIELELFA